MKTKKSVLEYLENNYDEFLEKLEKNYRYLSIGNDADSNTLAYVMTVDDLAETLGLPALNIHFYKRFHCGHNWDCCGCLSSQTIDIINNRNGFVTIFVGSRFNY